MASPVESFILAAQAFGIQLVLLWLLTLAIVWGLLQHANTPKSAGARGVIALAAAFMVLLAAAATPAMAFLSNLIVATVLIAFGLLIAVMFLEIAGVKVGEGKTVFQGHPKFFAAIILIIVLGAFLGAGGMAIIGFPKLQITDAVIAFLLFMAVIVAAIYMMMQETKEKKKD
jgi:hypothetical protein